ncbi:F-box protein At2g02240-like [Rutidosis leptorrhynchoides]|uniref:F-box protein At2g02240-like n=1 Tax=Rutidosis leptorrhynchoides TaxID=125765 RepID=UPI003A9A0AE0
MAIPPQWQHFLAPPNPTPNSTPSTTHDDGEPEGEDEGDRVGRFEENEEEDEKEELGFGEALVARYYFWNSNILNINKSRVLSPRTKYGSFIVYKLLEEGKTLLGPMKVRDIDLGSDYWYDSKFWYVYFVSPQTPVIRPKADQNTHNPHNLLKIEGLPQHRDDGWMEVQVYEIETDTDTTMEEILCLELKSTHMYLKGLIIQGIELRPI